MNHPRLWSSAFCLWLLLIIGVLIGFGGMDLSSFVFGTFLIFVPTEILSTDNGTW